MGIQKGDKFGKLTAQTKSKKNKWVFVCECGNSIEKTFWSVSKENKLVSQSCGCARKGIAPQNLNQLIKAGESTRLKKGLVPDHKNVIEEDLLRLMYLDLGMSLEEIGKKIDRPHSSVFNYLETYGIERRPAGFQIGNTIQSGDKHYNWKGGISTLTSSIRSSGKYLIWRKACFDRDNYKCSECGSKKTLCVHHKKFFSEILRDNNITSLEEAFACEELWDISNGTTLCDKHHKMIHKIGEKDE
jgi:5-methylcytosine-specific restriction endonuclease McrA